jgi:metal-responsive CopG/Arc/MetJ family transcriptional regulator
MKARTNRAAKDKRTTVAASRKIIVEFPAALYTATERATVELSTNRSALIRSAVAEYLARLQRQKLERELAEGYQANATQATQLAEDFTYAGTELL